MFFTKERPKTHQKQTQLSAEEAFRLWEKTRLRYSLIDQINLLGNYTHDVDFQLVLKNINEVFQKQAVMLEKQLNKYSIKAPGPYKRDIEAIGNSEVLEDRLAAQFVYNSLQHIVSKCFLSLRNSINNDGIRQLLYRITKEDINIYDRYVDFIVIKGWLEVPPLYKDLKNSDKRVASNEIWSLWKLLDNRYLSKHQTQYFIQYVSDKDFELVLSTGIEIVEKQINKLEEKLLYYGVNLPEKFSNIPTPEAQEQITDKYIFKLLFMSMQHSVTIEGFSMEELIINSDIRKMIKNFIFEEIDVINNLIKYSKIKGWAPLDPQFRSS